MRKAKLYGSPWQSSLYDYLANNRWIDTNYCFLFCLIYSLDVLNMFQDLLTPNRLKPKCLSYVISYTSRSRQGQEPGRDQ